MKRLTAALLCVVLLCTAGAALAATEKPLTFKYSGPTILQRGSSAIVLSAKINSTVSGEVSLRIDDKVKKTTLNSQSLTGVQAGDVLDLYLDFDDTLPLEEKFSVKRLQAVVSMDGKDYTYTLYMNYDKSKDEITVEKTTWYEDNTACSFGPQFREMTNPITDKWYMFTPVDLSRDGVQEFEYVASNLYVIGKVTLTVKGDSVTVTYHNYYEQAAGNTETKSEYLTFFKSLADVTEVEPEKLAVGYAFGQAISIEKDLGGDTNVLLYIRNKVTYCDYVNSTHKLTRFWINLPERVTLRNQLIAKMDK